jgi:hypothetical protein
MAWASYKPPSGIPARGPGHGGPASGIRAGHSSQGWGWGGPAKGASTAKPSRRSAPWEPGQRVLNMPTATSMVRHGRQKELLASLFDMVGDPRVDDRTRLTVVIRLLDILEGPPKPRRPSPTTKPLPGYR